MTKRSADFNTIASICDETSNVRVCGIVNSLSPLKKSRSNTDYFDGELADTTGKSDCLDSTLPFIRS